MNRRRRYFGTNRYVCSVLEEMRTCHETRNYSMMLSLIEEVQVLANRMEAALSDQKDIKEMQEYRQELKDEIRKLEKKVDELENKCPDTTKEKD